MLKITASLKPADVEKKWIVIDAEDAIVGRLAEPVQRARRILRTPVAALQAHAEVVLAFRHAPLGAADEGIGRLGHVVGHAFAGDVFHAQVEPCAVVTTFGNTADCFERVPLQITLGTSPRL